ncbi:MAG: hypothetical protein A2V70_09615 [Planctomycetes bacterium RBG_13_63_9]|nr:MAG: hypothetical protein A2V70_09615 [Planctomycetes bacterium RBG_13_63_9]
MSAAQKKSPKGGFSLLEVILSLAILAGAIAVLGEAARTGIRNAMTTRQLTQAQLLCESKLAEITAGIIEPSPVSGARFDRSYTGSGTTGTAGIIGDDQDEWQYSINIDQLNEEGLVAVRVTVEQTLPANKRPVKIEITRWIPDPDVELSEGSTSEESSEGSDSGGTSE